MKIEINYDLLSKISEANTGLSLQKWSRKTIFVNSILSILDLTAVMANAMTMEDAILDTVKWFFITSLYYGAWEFIDSKRKKEEAINDLRQLSQMLKSISINTNQELLLKSYKYETEYDLSNNERMPKLEQKKYIMIPVYEDGEEKEVSIVQEHIMGSNKYSLSYGSPRKVLKLAPNLV